MRITDTAVIARFNAKLDKTGQCWLWTGSKNWAGYGEFSVEGKLLKAHRVALAIVQDVPNKVPVLHSCDIRNCCNPEHLRLGTQIENVGDRTNKRRGRCKLSGADVRTIRRLRGVWPADRVAVKWGVSRGAIYNIWTGKAWKHVSGNLYW